MLVKSFPHIFVLKCYFWVIFDIVIFRKRYRGWRNVAVGLCRMAGPQLEARGDATFDGVLPLPPHPERSPRISPFVFHHSNLLVMVAERSVVQGVRQMIEQAVLLPSERLIFSSAGLPHGRVCNVLQKSIASSNVFCFCRSYSDDKELSCGLHRMTYTVSPHQWRSPGIDGRNLFGF